jgi:hypothetical protein
MTLGRDGVRSVFAVIVQHEFVVAEMRHRPLQ